MGMSIKPIGLLTLVAAMGLGGCTTNERIDKLENELRASNEQAAQDAASARTDAAEALRAANAAKAESAEAYKMARDAKRSSDNTDARIDRMFKKAMHK